MKVELLAITPNAEKVIENAGRTSYLSFDKEKEGSEKDFIKFIIKHGHLSVLEHSSATFRITGASRSFTHQLVRHRLASYTQQSQRYVNESNFEYVIPPSIKNNQQALKIYNEFIEYTKKSYEKLLKLNILKEDARYLLPNAVVSEIVLTANFRELRHIFKLRLNKKAQWEIRTVCLKMLEILKQKVQSVFEDFVIDYNTNTASTPYPD